ncbi:uncharacterized protein LOC119406249 isoform X2 [Rhipicephalus sanguineus]|uniref:uncharacterized protein LOC119406249 isoform X2 n=1 Tax=Rhipicephalus sanguineus TaxID=34632 RepID=UPI0018953B27|nr:uncharacterized protein LOC119406249 isoform X2 [Rhipicephalus sanguineus]
MQANETETSSIVLVVPCVQRCSSVPLVPRSRGVIHGMKRHLSTLLLNWPGRKTFGPYSFMPVFFIFGAALEFAMIKWTPGGKTNFSTGFPPCPMDIPGRHSCAFVEQPCCPCLLERSVFTITTSPSLICMCM